MNNQNIILLVFGILMVILIVHAHFNKTEHFYNSDCDSIESRNGIVCAVSRGGRNFDKCYRVWKSPQKPNGIILQVDTDQCWLYPECKLIGEKCKMPSVTKLG